MNMLPDLVQMGVMYGNIVVEDSIGCFKHIELDQTLMTLNPTITTTIILRPNVHPKPRPHLGPNPRSCSTPAPASNLELGPHPIPSAQPRPRFTLDPGPTPNPDPTSAPAANPRPCASRSL